MFECWLSLCLLKGQFLVWSFISLYIIRKFRLKCPLTESLLLLLLLTAPTRLLYPQVHRRSKEQLPPCTAQTQQHFQAPLQIQPKRQDLPLLSSTMQPAQQTLKHTLTWRRMQALMSISMLLLSATQAQQRSSRSSRKAPPSSLPW